ncbi:uncharacterized protein LOC132197406 isoform X2 [Neocloeon triangulifer]|uniref:uncharacterized protein LOC132197406 isoform X2 n=1 Tax=Neocloeon triangulifer TaxID=2078957 RepID=UPI00286F3160|nr:uncharacterized protein LOC132197406 isoform X2 [Neocloeon triangulifer]
MMNNFSLLLLSLVTVTGVSATWPYDWGLGGWGFGAWASKSSPSQERQDEVHDVEILKAVVTSMAEWERSRRDTSRAKRADSSVCYSNIGCFMGAAPFSYLGVLPAPPSEVGTSFHFFSPREPHRARSLSFEEIVVPAADALLDTGAAPEFAPLQLEPQQQSVRGRRDNAASDERRSTTTDDSNLNATTPSTTSTSTTSSEDLAQNDSGTISLTASSLEGSVLLEAALNLGFNSSLPTKVIVHGFGSKCSLVWVHEMKSALMAVEDCNVICVDWEPGASLPNYVRAAANTRLVGKQVALLLRKLKTQYGLDPRNVHLIGFSLGAHVAGFAGAETPGLSRISGLDPAGPLFEAQEAEARLDASDADFVDVIHSNGANLILGGLGSRQPMGHVDFYPNGGAEQKGCSNLLLGAVSDISFLWSSSEDDLRSLCNHRRAYKFFTDSVSSRCPFPAFPCESYEQFLEGECFNCGPQRQCGNMGYYSDRSPARGPMFLITRDNEPFCAHQFYVRVESTPILGEPLVTHGRFEVVLSNKDINETFVLTDKDDEVMETGEALYRLVVAHPAMDQLTSAQLVYTAYSGWISSGAPTWTVDKVSITDAYGKSMSFCKKGMIVSSGVPLLVPLFPGDCNPPRPPGLDFPLVPMAPINNELPNNASGEEVSGNKTTTVIVEGAAENKNKTGIDINISLHLNENTSSNADVNKSQTNQSNSSTTTDYPLYQRPWLEANNSLDVRLDNSRSMPHVENTKRSSINSVESAPPAGSWSFWWRTANKTEPPPPPAPSDGTGGGTLVTVQMLPKKLASILQQAEQYARSTLSSVTSTLIGGNKEAPDQPPTDGPLRRRAKYFPPFASLFGYEAKSRMDTVTFSPLQIIKNPEWRISRYIPLRRYASAARRVDEVVAPTVSPSVAPKEDTKPEAKKIIEPLLIGPR